MNLNIVSSLVFFSDLNLNKKDPFSIKNKKHTIEKKSKIIFIYLLLKITSI